MVVLAFNFTGYLLPWDQLSYWAVNRQHRDHAPCAGLGTEVAKGFPRGYEVGAATAAQLLRPPRAVLPAGMLALLGYHFWRIRKDGGISQPLTHPEGGDVRVTTIPHPRREAAVAAMVLTAVVAFDAGDGPAGARRRPAALPQSGQSGLVLRGTAGAARFHMETEAALVLLAIVGAAVVLVPVLDRDRATIGVYFRSTRGQPQRC